MAYDPNADAVLDNYQSYNQSDPTSASYNPSAGLETGQYYDNAGWYWGNQDLNSYVTSGQYDKDVKAGEAANKAADASRFTSSGGSSGGSGGGSVSYSVNAGYQGPSMDMPTFKAPEDYKSPDYVAPEYDEGLERKLRQQYMAPGMSQIRRGMDQATISSKSIDNPNARALFINQAFEGMGEAISQTSASATKSAQSEAQTRYSDELAKYDKQWNIQSSDSKLAWDKEWTLAMQEYEMGLKLFEQQPYENQVSAYNDMTGTGGGSSSPLSWSYKF